MMIPDGKPIFLDTNILVYMEVATAPLHMVARHMVQKYYDNGNPLWISRQILREYLVQVTRSQAFAHPLPITKATARVRYFQTHFSVAGDTPQVTDQLLVLLEQIATGGKQVHDANIVATMLIYDIRSILTHNVADFARFAHLITVIPLVQPT